jgi:aspartyl-tRNA(Asn)/glutamyl-tRNA(Gln) amidotransferase subunit B
MGDLMKIMKERQLEIDEMKLDAKPFARMIKLQLEGKINRNAAREILSEILERSVDPDEYVREHHLEMVTDDSGIRQCIIEILSTNAQSVMDFKSGKEKAFSFLIGQVMRQMKGKADPSAVHSILKEEMEKIS